MDSVLQYSVISGHLNSRKPASYFSLFINNFSAIGLTVTEFKKKQQWKCQEDKGTLSVK